ncbi:zfp-1 [Pristionchus pacificus]|uniref:PHD finger motif containing protein n=1 Tax=Pristionchus pacificus TaxID=54126 RepID=A0A2A6CHP7_PRIPA|nr:zfp-1 [Pristionchus pacificus]|eukprot:PDM77610.1 PHD finger motif containing protein [Pristionchus pacificus]
MKEMLGGCCVCSDENGWNGNPLVYCDGPDCEVAVHQGCYGILEVPEGEWLCAKCQIASANGTSKANGVDHRNGNSLASPITHPRCDLCPFGYGALKRTNKNSWAHVICALYIPEVKFGDVHSMDPVILDDVPQDRFDRTCYLCEDEGAPRSAKVGACMNCNRPGCKKSFHVTCAQRRGLLCEEGGASKNVKYCGYCAHHLKKAKAQDPSIKIVPPCKVRPLPSISNSIDRSIEKTIDNHSSHRSSGSGERKSHKSKYSSSYGSGSLSNSVRDSNHQSLTNGGSSGYGGLTSSSSSLASTPKRPTADENGEKMMIDQLRSEPSLGSTVLGAAAAAAAAAAAGASPSDILAAATGSTTFSPPLTSSSRSSLAQEGATPPLKESASLNGHGGAASSLPGPSTSTAASGSPSSSIPMGGSAATTLGRGGSSPAPSSALFLNGSHHLTNHNRLADAASPMSTSSGGGFTPATSKGLLNGHGRPGTASPSPQLQSTSQLMQAAAAAAANSATMLSALNTSEYTVACGLSALNSSVGSTTTHNHPNVHPSVSGSVPVGAAIAAGLVTPKAGLGAFPVSTHTTTKRAAKDHEGGGKNSKRARNNAKSSVRELLDAVEPLVSVTAAQAQQLRQQSDADVKPNTSDPMGLGSLTGGLMPSTSTSSLLGSMQQSGSGGMPQGVPATMEELLERQWEQGSSFVISNSHFDVAQLLSCLHQLKKENSRLEDTLSTMIKRRDHLLALNARLAMPLGLERLAATLAQSAFLNNPQARQQLLSGSAGMDPLISALLMQQQQQQQAAAASSLINPNTAALMRMFMSTAPAANGGK